MYYLAISIGEDKKLFDEVFRDCLIDAIPTLIHRDVNLILGVANLFIKFGYPNECLELLNSLDGIKNIDGEIVKDFFYYISAYKKQEIAKKGEQWPELSLTNDIDAKIELCNWFIKKDLMKEMF